MGLLSLLRTGKEDNDSLFEQGSFDLLSGFEFGNVMF